MSLDSSTDFTVIKRFWSALFEGVVFTTTGADDHFRYLIYELDNSGIEVLVFTSDSFTTLTGLSFIDPPSIPATFEFAPVDGKFYRIEQVAYDLGESNSVIEDEWFMFARPDEIQTQTAVVTTTGDPLPNAIDQGALDQLVNLMGGDVLHGEMVQADGYTTGRTTRGYGLLSLPAATADALLAASASPGDAGVTMKAKLTLTVSDNGNEISSSEVEQSI